MKTIYLTRREAAEYARVGLSMVQTWTHRDDFYPAIKIGRRIIIKQDSFDKWLQEFGQKNSMEENK